MKINIESGKCRNEDIGDWWQDEDGTIQIRVDPHLPNKSAVGVAIHELIEFLLCKEEGVSDEVVTAFDAQFLEEVKRGLHPQDAEAGDDDRAPYYSQHQAATAVERAVAHALYGSWLEHEANCVKTD